MKMYLQPIATRENLSILLFLTSLYPQLVAPRLFPLDVNKTRNCRHREITPPERLDV